MKTIFDMYKEENKKLQQINAELLEACKALLSVIKKFGFREPNNATSCLGSVTKAEQAIAKAER